MCNVRPVVPTPNGWGGGWSAEFADEGVSGSLGNRPALDELLTACRGGLIDVVVVHRLDRFGRSLRHLSNTLGELDEIGVQFVSVQEAFDSKGSAGRLQRNILSSVAQFEREQMVERSRSGLRAKVEAGWWPGGPPPFGFDLDRVGRHLRLVVNDAEAAVVRRTAELIVDQDCTVAQCAQRLNQEELRPRKAAAWEQHNLRRQIVEGCWSGVWRYGRGSGWQRTRNPGVTQTEIPALLDSERHLALLERVHRSDLGQRPQNQGSFHLLSRGILWSLCGQPCSGFTHAKTGRKVYCCPKNLYPSEPEVRLSSGVRPRRRRSRVVDCGDRLAQRRPRSRRRRPRRRTRPSRGPLDRSRQRRGPRRRRAGGPGPVRPGAPRAHPRPHRQPSKYCDEKPTASAVSSITSPSTPP